MNFITIKMKTIFFLYFDGDGDGYNDDKGGDY